MKSMAVSCAFCLLLLQFANVSNADMGRILVSEAQVVESAQKAIILHNGAEEVLILGTDIQADRNVGILRFIPFPAEPSVALAPDGVFDNASALLAKHGISFLVMTKGGDSSSQPVELLLHQQYGAHDMTVVRVADAVAFREWANGYFAERNLPGKERYETVEAVVDDYVQRGLTYFVLDYVELADETRFIEPVAYRFASDMLYYPLKTSNTFGGRGEIDLLLVLPGTLCTPSLGPFDSCLGFTNYLDNAQASTSATLTAEEAASLYPDADKFFGGGQVYLQMFQYSGDYSFDRDVLEDLGQLTHEAMGYQEEDDPMIRLEENPPAQDPRCSLLPDPGPCKGLFEIYYYDQAKESCLPAMYGGCQGVVPFETMDECRAACMAGQE